MSPAAKTAAAKPGRSVKTRSTIGAQWVEVAAESRFSPLRNLEPETLVSYIEAFETGDFLWLWRTMRAMERRDDVWKVAAAKTRKDVSRRAWHCTPLDGFEKDRAANDQADLLRTFYAGVRVTGFDCRNVVTNGVRGLVDGAMRAYNDQYNVHEIVWMPRPDGTLSAEFIRCPLEWFALRNAYISLVADGQEAQPLEPGGWLITQSDGVGVACAVAYMFKRLALGDWAVYSGRCGHPGIHGKTPAEKGTPQWSEFVGALRKFGREWACATGLDDVIEKVDLSVSGQLPYPGLVERMDRAIASLHRGADLSTLSAGQGAGDGASLQGDESDLICEDNCETITETFQSQIDRTVLEWRYGPGVEIRAGFRLLPPQANTVQQDILTDQALLNMGVKLSKRDVLARYDRREPDADDTDDDALSPVAPSSLGTPGSNPAPSFGSTGFGFANEASAPAAPAAAPDPVKAILGRAAARILDQGTPMAEAVDAALAEIERLGEALGAIDPAAFEVRLSEALFTAAAQPETPETSVA